MQSRYAPIVDAMHPREREQVEAVAPRWRSQDQADVVLALLRADALIPAVRLVGRPITLFPPSRKFFPKSVPHVVSRGPDDRVIRAVARNPHLPTTPAFQRYRALRPGLTLAQAMVRGVRRRDLRRAVRRGWVSVSP
jgi:hypothetical protein